MTRSKKKKKKKKNSAESRYKIQRRTMYAIAKHLCITKTLDEMKSFNQPYEPYSNDHLS